MGSIEPTAEQIAAISALSGENAPIVMINLLRYRGAGVAVLAIAIVVSILDYASATIRERLI